VVLLSFCGQSTSCVFLLIGLVMALARPLVPVMVHPLSVVCFLSLDAVPACLSLCRVWLAVRPRVGLQPLPGSWVLFLRLYWSGRCGLLFFDLMWSTSRAGLFLWCSLWGVCIPLVMRWAFSPVMSVVLRSGARYTCLLWGSTISRCALRVI